MYLITRAHKFQMDEFVEYVIEFNEEVEKKPYLCAG